TGPTEPDLGRHLSPRPGRPVDPRTHGGGRPGAVPRARRDGGARGRRPSGERSRGAALTRLSGTRGLPRRHLVADSAPVPGEVHVVLGVSGPVASPAPSDR